MTETDKKIEEATGPVREYVHFLENLIENHLGDEDEIIHALVGTTVDSFGDDCECSDTFLIRHKRYWSDGEELGNTYKIVDGTGIEFKED